MADIKTLKLIVGEHGLFSAMEFSLWFMGRADDVVKFAGNRIGTTEVKSALVSQILPKIFTQLFPIFFRHHNRFADFITFFF